MCLEKNEVEREKCKKLHALVKHSVKNIIEECVDSIFRNDVLI